jgi:NTP pyrophosphatase (non-canonical NTP hydrolase)
LNLDEYQDAAAATDALDRHGSDPLVALLGLGAHVGDLLDAHKQYLRASLDLTSAIDLISHELGSLLWYVCALARRHDLTLSDVALSNLVKTRERAASRGVEELGPVPEEPMDFRTYQDQAQLTDEHIDSADVSSVTVPLLGLIGEAGNLLNAQKKYYTDHQPTSRDKGFIRIELGDLLWYISTAASHCQLDLGAIADANLEHTRRYNPAAADQELPVDLPILDANFPPQERFPRRFVLRFVPVRTAAGAPHRAQMHLVAAHPNAFPDGPVELPQAAGAPGARTKFQGFAVGAPLGDPLSDNSTVADGYRFHDAIHLGFLATLGWSATMRSLLRVKRRSDPVVDDAEDGARAIFAEEGVAALLARRSASHGNFVTESSVDGDTLEIVTTVFEHLEVSAYDPWVWRRAIAQGFTLMQQLAENRGSGYATVDLDRRLLTYSRTPPTETQNP